MQIKHKEAPEVDVIMIKHNDENVLR